MLQRPSASAANVHPLWISPITARHLAVRHCTVTVVILHRLHWVFKEVRVSPKMTILVAGTCPKPVRRKSSPRRAGRHRCCQLSPTEDRRQFIILSVQLCVQHDEREAARCAGPSAAADTCRLWPRNTRSRVYVTGVRPSVRLSHRSTTSTAADGFAAEHPAGRDRCTRAERRRWRINTDVFVSSFAYLRIKYVLQ